MTLPTIAPGKTKLGWIGTGVMGQSMCGHLLAAGYSATVYSRTAAKAEGLIARVRNGRRHLPKSQPIAM